MDAVVRSADVGLQAASSRALDGHCTGYTMRSHVDGNRNGVRGQLTFRPGAGTLARAAGAVPRPAPTGVEFGAIPQAAGRGLRRLRTPGRRSTMRLRIPATRRRLRRPGTCLSIRGRSLHPGAAGTRSTWSHPQVKREVDRASSSSTLGAGCGRASLGRRGAETGDGEETVRGDGRARHPVGAGAEAGTLARCRSASAPAGPDPKPDTGCSRVRTSMLCSSGGRTARASRPRLAVH